MKFYSSAYHTSENVRIVSGSGIPSPKTNSGTYHFSYIDFANVQINQFVSAPKTTINTNDITSRSELETIMAGKNAMIYVHTISMADLSYNPKAQNGFDPTCLLTVNEASNYAKLPTCMRTDAGSLIPQVIIPGENYYGIQNGVTIQGSNDYFNRAMSGSKAINNWVASMIPLSENSTSAQKNAVSNYRTYGHAEELKSNMLGYVNNNTGKNQLIDSPAIATRTYTFNIKSSYDSSGGAFAFCYKMMDYTADGVGKNASQKKMGPIIDINVPMKSFRNYSGESQSSFLQMSIPKNGDIYVQMGCSKFGFKHANGGFSETDKDFCPPQCREEDVVVCKPLIVYNTYHGVVITNSIIKNALTGTEQIFLRSDKGSYNQQMRVLGTSVSTQVSTYLKNDPEFQMKWFPTLMKQNSTNFGVGIANPMCDVFLNGKITLKFIKCLGNFAYVPVFFHNAMNFTLYFKGSLKDSSEKDTTYKIYPVVYFPPGQSYNVEGKSKIKYASPKDGHGPDIYYLTPTTVYANKPLSTNSSLQECIYSANIEIDASTKKQEALRYPLQAFGAVIVCKSNKDSFTMVNSNGYFNITSNVSGEGSISLNTNYSGAVNSANGGNSTSPSWFDLITRCDISFGLDGATGKLTLDSYASDAPMLIRAIQDIGELDLDVQWGNGSTSSLFKGFAMQIAQDNSENNYNINVNLYGIQKKMEDMKLIAAPFWDGDKLESICLYFEKYLNLQIKMISSAVKSFSTAKSASTGAETSTTGTWSASNDIVVRSTRLKKQTTNFRVPRSDNWESPAENFVTGTSCLEALKKLGQDTSCVFIPGIDGVGYYYELNENGIPYYVNEQTTNIVEFECSDIISINLTPSLNNKYNAIATFGFLQVRQTDNKTGKLKVENALFPGVNYTQITDTDSRAGQVIFPWTRAYVSVENGYFSNVQLENLHENKVKFAVSQIYTGNMTVAGNTLVNHLYQKIKVNGELYFVISIDHSIDLTTKQWTTSYGLNYFQPPTKK